MIDKTHPYFFLKRLFHSREMTVSFSKYVYEVDSLFDKRSIIEVRSQDICSSWVSEVISDLTPDEELALHSDVTIGSKTYHIPMIDFSVEKEFGENVTKRLGYFVTKPVMREMEFFSSGRSFHGYSTRLIGPKEWREFNGRLLLVNSSSVGKIIDSRWVGHRLISGYSSLRWSCNTNVHMHNPKRMNKFSFEILDVCGE